MNIIETKIPDINVKNIDQSKVNLAEKIKIGRASCRERV